MRINEVVSFLWAQANLAKTPKPEPIDFASLLAHARIKDKMLAEGKSVEEILRVNK